MNGSKEGTEMINALINYSTVCSVFDKGYRYGFNGMARDRDIANDDYDFGARIYDSRLGRFLSVDPEANNTPFYSDYCFAANSPLLLIDFEGRSVKVNHLPGFYPHTFTVTPTATGFNVINTNDQPIYYNNFTRELSKVNGSKYYVAVSVTNGLDLGNSTTQVSGNINHPNQTFVQQGAWSSNPQTSGTEKVTLTLKSRRVNRLEILLSSVSSTKNDNKTTFKEKWVNFRLNLAKRQLKRVNNRVERRTRRGMRSQEGPKNPNTPGPF